MPDAAFRTFLLSELKQRQTYNLLIGLCVPRPIALVTSMDRDGRLNAAPFSAYNYVGTDPAIVALGIGNRPDTGAPKDSIRNVRAGGEFVVNVVTEEIAEAMNICATDFPPDISELPAAGLTTVPSSAVKVPRIAEAAAALECREVTTLEIGRNHVLIGEVLAFQVREDLVDPAGPYIRADQLHAIGRMNGLGTYTKTRDMIQIPRIPYAEWVKREKPSA